MLIYTDKNRDSSFYPRYPQTSSFSLCAFARGFSYWQLPFTERSRRRLCDKEEVKDPAVGLRAICVFCERLFFPCLSL